MTTSPKISDNLGGMPPKLSVFCLLLYRNQKNKFNDKTKNNICRHCETP